VVKRVFHDGRRRRLTKQSGDGGIDGYGTIRIGGLISFNVLFQSKRYKDGKPLATALLQST